MLFGERHETAHFPKSRRAPNPHVVETLGDNGPASIGLSDCGDCSSTDGAVTTRLNRHVVCNGDHAGDSCGQEEKLRGVAALERSRPSSRFLAQEVIRWRIVHAGVRPSPVRTPTCRALRRPCQRLGATARRVRRQKLDR